MQTPFELLAPGTLLLFSWKITFLVTITSTCRVTEFALEPPFTVFYKNKVKLHTQLAFLTEMVSEFHMSQDIYLPIFYSKTPKLEKACWLYSLDVRIALTFYIEQSKPISQIYTAVLLGSVLHPVLL